MDIERIFLELNRLGIPVQAFLDYAIFAPVVLFITTIGMYGLSVRQRKLRMAQDRVAQSILSGARRRSTTLSQDEIAARLRPQEEEASASEKSFLTISELLLKLVKFDKEKTKKSLVQAGERDPKALTRYIIQRGMGMIIAPVVLWFLMGFLGFEGILQMAVALAGILVGGIVVDVRLDKAVANRRTQVFSQLPVLMDLLTIYLEAGQGFDVALARASAALKTAFPVAASEIGILRKELETSIDRERVLREFAERMNTQTARTFVAIVIQSERRGNAVAPALRSLAREARKEVMTDVEKRAQKIPTMMQLPMFVFILPAIFAAVIGPAVVQVITEFGAMP